MNRMNGKGKCGLIHETANGHRSCGHRIIYITAKITSLTVTLPRTYAKKLPTYL